MTSRSFGTNAIGDEFLLKPLPFQETSLNRGAVNRSKLSAPFSHSAFASRPAAAQSAAEGILEFSLDFQAAGILDGAMGMRFSAAAA